MLDERLDLRRVMGHTRKLMGIGSASSRLNSDKTARRPRAGEQTIAPVGLDAVDHVHPRARHYFVKPRQASLGLPAKSHRSGTPVRRARAKLCRRRFVVAEVPRQVDNRDARVAVANPQRDGLAPASRRSRRRIRTTRVNAATAVTQRP